MLNFKPIKSNSVNQVVYEKLVEAIVSGQLKPGERLTIEGLASQLEVSNMPVREALRMLEVKKLVQKETNRTLTVSRLSVTDIKEIIEIRLLLEPYAAIRSLQIHGIAILDVLEGFHEKMKKTKDEEKYLSLNRDFHFYIYKKSDLGMMVEIINSLWERYSPYLYILHRSEKQWPNKMVIENHQGIIDSIKEKNEEQLKSWISKDLQRSSESIIKMISGVSYGESRRV